MRKEFFVRSDRAYTFKDLAVSRGCCYLNMYEHIRNELFSCDLNVPEDIIDAINDMAFMTFVDNPEFQKYY